LKSEGGDLLHSQMAVASSAHLCDAVVML